MGLNIHICRIKDGKRTWEEIPFDRIRYLGDKEFVINTEFIYARYPDIEDPSDPGGPPHEGDYRRPSDVEKIRAWVKLNVPKGNQERLLNLLKLLEQDSDLWLEISW